MSRHAHPDGAAMIQLLRHGEAAGGPRFRGSTDDPLTVRGWHQMEASALEAGKWQAVVTSPLRRCIDFAQSLACRLTLPLTVDARLREIHFGQWEGRSAAEIADLDPDALTRFWRQPTQFTPPAGESFACFSRRVLAAWRELTQRPESTLLVITHAGPIRVILCHTQGQPMDRLLEWDAGLASLHTICRAQACRR